MSGRTLWLAAEPLILASGSAARRDMLSAAGVPVEIVRPEIDERTIEARLEGEGATPDRTAIALAVAKAEAVSKQYPTRLVLAADQTLACDGECFHKPADMAGAAAQLAALAGRSHRLHSAFALARDAVVLAQACDHADLRMRSFDADFIARYLAGAGAAVLASVGAYQLEGLGAQLFECIEGDHFTILGLPLLPVLAALREQGCLAR